MRRELPAPFSAEVTRHGDVLHLVLVGELDLATTAELEATLPEPAAGDTVVLDLRELSFIDSSGIHAIMRLDVAARAQGWSLVAVRGRPAVQRVLDLCHVGDRVRMVDAPADVSPLLG
jgi:anti-anti-sigma factor